MNDIPSLDLDKTDSAQREVPFSVPPPADVTFEHRVMKYHISDDILDPDAIKVVRRLARFGYEAYLVGGCIRDIMFGKRPKDFDVATSALPQEVKRLFRNCRLIGRRFRLAHLFFKNGKIIEVATFRRGATNEDDVSSRHAAENLFGGPADDAVRRDFTINALMYDVGKKQIHDYVSGLEDVKARMLNTIGNADRRFQEDPIRIIRAVKFARRLDLAMEEHLTEAMRRYAPLVTECAPARLVEELFKVMRSGESTSCMKLLAEIGVLECVMPEMGKLVSDTHETSDIWRFLERLDQKVKTDNHVSDATMLGALVYPFCRSALEQGGDLAAEIHKNLVELISPMKFPKRLVANVRQILVAQPRLANGPATKRARRILEREYASEALDLMEIIAEDDDTTRAHEQWISIYSSGRPPVAPRRRRRRQPHRKQETNPEGPQPAKSRRSKSRRPRAESSLQPTDPHRQS